MIFSLAVKLRSFFLLLTTIFLMTGNAYADSNSQNTFLEKLKKDSVNIQSISSDFVQQSFISLFQDKIESRGKFIFARPDNLRWEYSTPFASGFLLKGNTGLRWDAAQKDQTRIDTESAPEMAVIAKQILAWTTMDIDWIKTRYSIKITEFNPAVMELTPKSKTARSFMSKIIIFFSADATHLQSIELHEPEGDYTKISFQNVRFNESLPDWIFERK